MGGYQAVLSGIMKCSNPEHPEHPVRYVGEIEEVLGIVAILGLEMDANQEERARQAVADSDATQLDPRTESLLFHGDDGSIVTVEAAMPAGQVIAQLVMGRGMPHF